MSTYILPASPPQACPTCRGGCACPDGPGGCGHYGCRGHAPLSCPAALASQAAYEERLAATRRHRAVLAARRARWRSAADAYLLAHLLP
jgi:hypothetical protein